MSCTQRNAGLFLTKIPDDIDQLTAYPHLGKTLIHEESLAFGIAGYEVSPVIQFGVEQLHGLRIEQHRRDGRRHGSLVVKSLVVVEPVNGVRVLRVVLRGRQARRTPCGDLALSGRFAIDDFRWGMS